MRWCVGVIWLLFGFYYFYSFFQCYRHYSKSLSFIKLPAYSAIRLLYSLVICLLLGPFALIWVAFQEIKMLFK